MTLASEGELELSERFSKYYQFKNTNIMNKLKDITIEELLNHSSGLIPWYPFYTETGKSFEDILDNIVRKHPLKRGIVQYSDINFILLGKLIERIMGKTLNISLNELVFKPLNLQNTEFKPLEDNLVATEYGNKIELNMVRDRGLSFKGFRDVNKPIIGKPNDGNCHYYFGGISGHAGIFSTAEDLNVLCTLYQNKGRFDNKTIIKEMIIDKSFINYGDGRGLGWQISNLYPEGLGHTGFTGTSIYLNLKRKFNVIILTNRLHVDKPVNIAEFRLAIHKNVFKNLKGEN